VPHLDAEGGLSGLSERLQPLVLEQPTYFCLIAQLLPIMFAERKGAQNTAGKFLKIKELIALPI
jgi:hypothetical protein